jgi:lantibiotic biosynthesis protein
MKKKILDLILSSVSIVKETPPSGIISVLNSGDLARILYWAYLGKVTNSEEYKSLATEQLNAVFGKISDDPSIISNAKLFYGIPAILSICKILKEDNLIDCELDEETELALIHQMTLHLENQLNNNNTDFLSGFCGTIHFLAMYVQENNSDMLNLLTQLTLKLLQKANITDKGAFFFNSYFSKNNTQVSLGIAHGQCGIFLALCELYKKGICRNELAVIIPLGIEFILSLAAEEEDNLKSVFPTVSLVGEDKRSADSKQFYGTRVAWCYGDINVVLLLYRAGRILENSTYIELADKIGLQTANRKSLSDPHVDSACFCHGTTSLVQFYKALQNECEHDYYTDSINFWLNQSIPFYQEDIELPKMSNKDKADFLNGIIGSSIVLMTELLDNQTSWQKLFFL